MSDYREVTYQGRTYMVDEEGVVQTAPGVDMEAYDAELIAMGYVFEDDPPEDEEPVAELTFLVDPDSPLLKVVVGSGYSGECGSYVFEGGVLRWEGKDGHPEPFGPGPRNKDGRQLDRGILATDDYRDGWIECGPDPERWLRRLPGFLDMRGHMYARIVRDR